MNNAGFTQSIDQWTSCSLMHRFVKDHESILIQCTCLMWIWSSYYVSPSEGNKCNIAVVCRWCSSLCTIRSGPLTLTWMFCCEIAEMKISISCFKATFLSQKSGVLPFGEGGIPCPWRSLSTLEYYSWVMEKEIMRLTNELGGSGSSVTITVPVCVVKQRLFF